MEMRQSMHMDDNIVYKKEMQCVGFLAAFFLAFQYYITSHIRVDINMMGNQVLIYSARLLLIL